jgi:hypothetical protein
MSQIFGICTYIGSHGARLAGLGVGDAIAAKASAKPSALKDALAAYRVAHGDHLDPKAIAVLDRLTADSEAACAFGKLNVDGRAAASILTACIEADVLARTFNDRIEIEGKMLGESGKGGQLDKLDKAVADLRSFINEFDCEPADRLSAFVRYDPADTAAMRRGLYLLADAIAVRRRIAKETRLRMGATRKMVDGGKAAETAAIGWIAEGVQRCCGRPYRRAAADLAAATLCCEVSEERLREAARTRRRDWRER